MRKIFRASPVYEGMTDIASNARHCVASEGVEREKREREREERERERI